MKKLILVLIAAVTLSGFAPSAQAWAGRRAYRNGYYACAYGYGYARPIARIVTDTTGIRMDTMAATTAVIPAIIIAPATDRIAPIATTAATRAITAIMGRMAITMGLGFGDLAPVCGARRQRVDRPLR